jgi:hypothetical protein
LLEILFIFFYSRFLNVRKNAVSMAYSTASNGSVCWIAAIYRVAIGADKNALRLAVWAAFVIRGYRQGIPNGLLLNEVVMLGV